ncbi:MAG: cell division protein SepF [Oscillospiraceae bacterium]|nr:cell division protein SepF [Oscillospiraceae bacterium]
MGLRKTIVDWMRPYPEDHEPELDYHARPDEIEPAVDRSSVDKVVKLHTTTQLKVVVVRPEHFDIDTKAIFSHLMSKKTVVLNLEQADPKNSQRFMDFLSGAAYALGGDIKPIATRTYMIMPYNVDIQGCELLTELENCGVLNY